MTSGNGWGESLIPDDRITLLLYLHTSFLEKNNVIYTASCNFHLLEFPFPSYYSSYLKWQKEVVMDFYVLRALHTKFHLEISLRNCCIVQNYLRGTNGLPQCKWGKNMNLTFFTRQDWHQVGLGETSPRLLLAKWNI